MANDSPGVGTDQVRTGEPPLPIQTRQVGKAVAYLVVGAILAVTIIFSVPGVVLLQRGVRHLKDRPVDELTLDDLDEDERRPILLLRPFAEDSGYLPPKAMGPLRPWTWHRFVVPRYLYHWNVCFMTFRWSFEQILKYATRKVGPLVAIGQPGRAPVLGAFNVYVGDDWHERVIGLTEQAQLVVLVAGTTPGLLLEVDTVRRHLEPEQLVLYVPNGTRRNAIFRKGNRRTLYEQFRELTTGVFDPPLPEEPSKTAFWGFGPGWVPAPLDLSGKPPASNPAPHVARIMQSTGL